MSDEEKDAEIKILRERIETLEAHIQLLRNMLVAVENADTARVMREINNRTTRMH